MNCLADLYVGRHVFRRSQFWKGIQCIASRFEIFGRTENCPACSILMYIVYGVTVACGGVVCCLFIARIFRDSFSSIAVETVLTIPLYPPSFPELDASVPCSWSMHISMFCSAHKSKQTLWKSWKQRCSVDSRGWKRIFWTNVSPTWMLLLQRNRKWMWNTMWRGLAVVIAIGQPRTRQNTE